MFDVTFFVEKVWFEMVVPVDFLIVVFENVLSSTDTFFAWQLEFDCSFLVRLVTFEESFEHLKDDD